MEKVNKLICMILLSFLLAACQSYKKVPYLQDVEAVNQATQQETLYDAKIMPKDLLTIVVSCTSPELAAPFNLTIAARLIYQYSTLLLSLCYNNIWLTMKGKYLFQY